MKNDIKVWLKREVLAAIKEEAARWKEKETGGVLIGYWSDDETVVVTSVIGPGPNARHTPTSFIPDQEFHEKEIERIYELSGRIETYLGDWHTHPNSSAYLSGQDKKTLSKIAAYKPARLTKPLMLIVGTKPLECKIWYCLRLSFLKRFYDECQCRLFE